MLRKILLNMLAALACSLSANSQTPEWAWLKTVTSQEMYHTAPALDNAGNSYEYMGGSPNIDLRSQTVEQGSWLVKRNNAGAILWVKKMPGGLPYGVKVDAMGNIYLLGTFSQSTIAPYNIVSRGGLDIFILKLNRQGELVWLKSVGSSMEDVTCNTGLQINSNNEVVVTGGSYDTPYYDGTPLTGLSGGRSFVLSINPDGTLKNYLLLQGVGAASLAIDAHGQIFLGASVSGDIWFSNGQDSTLYPETSPADAFVIKLNPQLSVLRFYPLGSSSAASGKVLDVKPLLDGSFYLNTGGIGSSSRYLISRYDSAGVAMWYHTLDQQHWGVAATGALATDAAENLYVAGVFRNNLVYRGDTLAMNPTAAAYALRLRPDGSVYWLRTIRAKYALVMGNPRIAIGRGTCIITGMTSDSVLYHGSDSAVFYKTNMACYTARLDGVTGLSVPGSTTIKSFGLWPNPATSSVRISIPDALSHPLSVTVSDASGRLIHQQALAPGSRQAEISVAAMPAGVYLMSMDGYGSKKMLVR